MLLESQVGSLQNLIHRYFTQPNDDLLQGNHQSARQRCLARWSIAPPTIRSSPRSAEDLMQATERFVNGFSDLRNVQSAITTSYENQVLKPAQEMAGLYAILEDAAKTARP